MEATTPMIKAIFFTRFHPKKGARVLHQVPEGSIIPSKEPSLDLPLPLIDFHSVSDYLIPKQDFCDRLVTVLANRYRIIGFPVCIEDEDRYDRNQFIFNLSIVLDEDADMSAHASVVRKLARMFRNLEEQNGFLSKEENDDMWDTMSDYGETDDSEEKASRVNLRSSFRHEATIDEDEYEDDNGLMTRMEGGQKVYAICEMVLEDLNNYCECMIPIDEANTINLKLFPARAPPAPVRAWHVPLLTIQSSLLSLSSTSDLTLSRIVPYINGIRSVAQIARLADTDLSLARKAVQHLLYYGCVLLLDIFQFSAVYAPTPSISEFVGDIEAQDEAVRYVSVGQYQQVTADDSPDMSQTDLGSSLSSSPVAHRAVSISTGEYHGSASRRSPLGLSPSNASESTNRISSLPKHHSGSSTVMATPRPSPTSAGRWAWHHDSTSLTRARIIQLYTSLRPGLPLRDWCLNNETLLSGLDVRRFITFGIIKGFLYRAHRWAHVDLASLRTQGSVSETNGIHADTNAERIARWDAQVKQGGSGNSSLTEDLGQHGGTAQVQGQSTELSKARLAEATRDLPLARYLDGLHCFDEICTELQMSEKEVVGRMRQAYGNVQIIAR